MPDECFDFAPNGAEIIIPNTPMVDEPTVFLFNRTLCQNPQNLEEQISALNGVRSARLVSTQTEGYFCTVLTLQPEKGYKISCNSGGNTANLQFDDFRVFAIK